MEKKFILVATGEDANDTGIVFIEADSADEALEKWLVEYQGFDLEDEYHQINSMLEEMPIGLAEIVEGNDNPEIEWYMELP